MSRQPLVTNGAFIATFATVLFSQRSLRLEDPHTDSAGSRLFAVVVGGISHRICFSGLVCA